MQPKARESWPLCIHAGPENQVVVKVRDTGCGIPAENLKTIFEPFFTTKGDKGTGIGLWVIKGIVDKLGGKIEVESSTTGNTRNLFQHFPASNERQSSGCFEIGRDCCRGDFFETNRLRLWCPLCMDTGGTGRSSYPILAKTTAD